MVFRAAPAALLLLLAGACAAPPPSGNWTLPAAAQEGRESGDPEWADKRNRVAVFVGGIWDEGGREGFGVGAEYEYRVNELIGFGFLAEYAFGSVDKSTGLGLVFWHVAGPWTVVTGLGAESPAGRDTEVVVRLGGTYDVDLGSGLILQPQANLDFKESGVAFVVGVSIGTLF